MIMGIMIITRRAWTTTWQIELSINSHVYEQRSDIQKQPCTNSHVKSHRYTSLHYDQSKSQNIFVEILISLIEIFSGMITKKQIINNHQSTSKLVWNNICNICKPKCEGGLGIRKLRILILLRKIGMAHSYIYIYVDMNRPYEHNECI